MEDIQIIFLSDNLIAELAESLYDRTDGICVGLQFANGKSALEQTYGRDLDDDKLDEIDEFTNGEILSFSDDYYQIPAKYLKKIIEKSNSFAIQEKRNEKIVAISKEKAISFLQ